MWRLLNLTKPSKLIQLLRCFGSEMNHAKIRNPQFAISSLSTIFLHGIQEDFTQRRKGAKEKVGGFAPMREPL
jgi:hypothetical protein